MKTNWIHESFRSERLKYKEIAPDMFAHLVRWRSDPQLIRYYKSTKPVTRNSHIKWYENTYLPSETRYDYTIYETENQAPVGIVGVDGLSFAQGSACIGYMIGERTCQRRGFAKEAILALMDRYHTQGAIRCFFAEIHRRNAPSLKTVQALGFEPIAEKGEFVTMAYHRGR